MSHSALSEDAASDFAVQEPASESRGSWFYPQPLWQLVLFGTLGGTIYAMFWSYRNWKAYGRAWGYSRAAFWERVHTASGYRPSAFWRGVITAYSLCLFPAVNRECAAQQVSGMSAPIALAFLYSFLPLGPLLLRALGLPPLDVVVILLFPVQRAINRLNQRNDEPVRARFNAGEILVVVLGILWQLHQSAGAGGGRTG